MTCRSAPPLTQKGKGALQCGYRSCVFQPADCRKPAGFRSLPDIAEANDQFISIRIRRRCRIRRSRITESGSTGSCCCRIRYRSHRQRNCRCRSSTEGSESRSGCRIRIHDHDCQKNIRRHSWLLLSHSYFQPPSWFTIYLMKTGLTCYTKYITIYSHAQESGRAGNGRFEK